MTVSLAHAESIHQPWSELLGKYVTEGSVDYTGLKKEEGRLDEYLKVIDSTDPQSLQEKDRLAYYINAYNSNTVKLILDNFKDGRPVSSIKKLGGFFTGPWKIEFCRLGGKVFSLDNIEHDIIRPQFRDPRIHFAINCAAKSCPPLIAEAYEGDTLDRQLDRNVTAFLADRKFTYLEGNTLKVSKIFQWFSEDFNDDILGFVKKNAGSELKKALEGLGEKVTIEYLDYDWSLNGR